MDRREKTRRLCPRKRTVMLAKRLNTRGIVCATFAFVVGACGGVDTGAQVDEAVGETNAALSKARGSAGDPVADLEVRRRDFTGNIPREIGPRKLNNPAGAGIDKTPSPVPAYPWDSANRRIP